MGLDPYLTARFGERVRVRGDKRVIATRYPAACWSLAEIPAQRGCRELHSECYLTGASGKEKEK